MLLFGLVGRHHADWPTPFAVPLAVLLLAFLMGCRTPWWPRCRRHKIRTTHVTGTVTDLGIGMGEALYWNRSGAARAPGAPTASVWRCRQAAGHVSGGLGLLGAAGFKYLGFICVVPLALALLLLALPPLW